MAKGRRQSNFFGAAKADIEIGLRVPFDNLRNQKRGKPCEILITT